MENGSAPGGDSLLPQRAIVVGREPELRLLDELADRTVEEGVQVAFISGEAGIGKSTLVNHFLRSLTDKRWAVHVAQCIEYSERAIPFGPVISLVRSVLREASDRAEELLGHHRADLAALLPEWRAEGVDGASLSGDVDRLIDAISTLLIRAADARPMALFVEDIHWADGPTRDVVASLVHTLGPTRVLVVVSERTGAVPRGHLLKTWLAEQRRFPNVQNLTLKGLSAEALSEQAERILGEVPDASLVAEIAKRTGGNAYFSSELLLAKRSGETSLPTSLADFLTSRIEQLGVDEQQVLQAMAVAGEAISHRTLAAALPDLDVGPPLRQLFDLALITVDNGDYNFGHALMREAMMNGILPFEAADLHRRIAEAMVADPDRTRSIADLGTLAMHWAGANDARRSLATTVEAAQASAKVAAYEPAAEFAVHALARWSSVDDPEELTGIRRGALTVDASDWLLASNQQSAAGELLSDALAGWAIDLADGRRALLLAKLAYIRFLTGKPAETTSLTQQANALVGDEISPEAAQVHHLASQLGLFSASIYTALEAANRVIDIATEVGPEPLLIEALTTKALGMGVTVSMEVGIELVHEARRRALAENLVSQVVRTFRTEMHIISHTEGRTQKSFDALREGVAFANQRCGPSLRLDIEHELARGLVEVGNLTEAAPLLEHLTLSSDETLRSLNVLQTKALSGLLAGNLDQVTLDLSAARALATRFSLQEMGFQYRLEAELARQSGQFDTALERIDAALELQFEMDNLTFTRESVIEKCRLVRVVSALDAERATELAPAAESAISKLDVDPTSSLGQLMRLELAVARGTAEAAEAEALAARLASSGFGADAKLTALLHAQLLAAEQPRSEELARAVAAVRELGESSGMTLLCDGADAIAKADDPLIDVSEVIDITDGGQAHGDTPDHGLTPREIEVLGYLARGLTNKEIGVELYVSHRTVSTHVSNLLSKLHLKNRSEAASKFHELGFAKAAL